MTALGGRNKYCTISPWSNTRPAIIKLPWRLNILMGTCMDLCVSDYWDDNNQQCKTSWPITSHYCSKVDLPKLHVTNNMLDSSCVIHWPGFLPHLTDSKHVMVWKNFTHRRHPVLLRVVENWNKAAWVIFIVDFADVNMIGSDFLDNYQMSVCFLGSRKDSMFLWRTLQALTLSISCL